MVKKYLYIGKWRHINKPEANQLLSEKKIGITNDYKNRAYSFMPTKSPVEFHLLAVWESIIDAKKLEKLVHKHLFKDYRTVGEWFEDTDNTMVNNLRNFIEDGGLGKEEDFEQKEQKGLTYKYDEAHHLDYAKNETKELYQKYKEAILQLSPNNININPTYNYIAFKLSNQKSNKKNICDIVLHVNSLTIYINLKKGKLDDPKMLTKDISKTGGWGNGDYRISTIKDENNFDDIMSLIKQSLDKKI
ncbi:MAG: GIY-YIG nuclease family protein [Alphaproteobacteria bacterium]